MAPPLLAQARLAALDFETSGFSEGRHRVVEVGVVFIERLKIGERFQSLINPGFPIHPAATAVHGIADADVAGAPPFAGLAVDLRTRLQALDAVVCHNAPFDMPLLQRELASAGLPLLDRPVVDTLAAARAAWGRGENGLSEVAARLGIPSPAAHRAVADAETTARVLIEFAGAFGEDFPLAGFPGWVADATCYSQRVRDSGGGPKRAPQNPMTTTTRQAALAAYAVSAAAGESNGPQNQTVMRILLNSAARRGREVTLVLAPPARGSGGRAAAPASRRTDLRRVAPRLIDDDELVVFCPIKGAEERVDLARILEVRW